MPLSSLPRRLFWLIVVGFISCQQAFAGSCGDAAVSTSLAAGGLANAVQLDKSTTGQPLGGAVVFTVPTSVLSKDGPPLVACFRMRPRDQHAWEYLISHHQGQWTENLPLRVLDSKSDITTVSVGVPGSISSYKGAGSLVKRNVSLSDRYYAYDGLWPLADFRVRVAGATGAPVLDEIIPISITSYRIAFGFAVVGTFLFWLGMRYMASRKHIPGGFILSVIANRNGYASLSQLQIMMWTIVIGAASIYVVLLTGRLLDIPTQTLALLGIAGATTVAVALPKTGTDGQPAAAAPAPAPAGPPAPGAVTSLGFAGDPGTDRVVISWAPPEGGGIPTGYVVEQRTVPTGQAPGNWGMAAGGAAGLEVPVEVTGLAANTRYQFRVTASNAAVPGPATESETITTAQGAGAARPDQPQGVRRSTGAPRSDRITVEWNPLAQAPDAYVVRFRRAGDTAWNVAGVAGRNDTSLDIQKLTGDTDYEFHIRAVAAGQMGPASAIVSGRTAVRNPEWMDLVVWDGTHEIDVTRLQMLFFTVVAGIFVVVKVAAQNEVPEIPQGLLLLMGLSNGVYLSSKFVSGRR